MDLFLIVAAYVPCMCAVGWCIEVGAYHTLSYNIVIVIMFNIYMYQNNNIPQTYVYATFAQTKADVTTKDRFIDMLFVAVLEILVAASTLIYCYFLMPMFFALTSAWLQMLWLCVLHPLYFEIFTGFIVRKVLYRNRSLGRSDVVYFLTIVHAMVHTVALATSLQVRPPVLLCMVYLYAYILFLDISLYIVCL